jgi:predicted aldo/keto reductase-like oxidoreductase
MNMDLSKMGDVEFSAVSRRKFLHQTGAAVGSVVLGGQGVWAASPAGVATAAEGLPRRVLGRTKIPVSILTLGTAPCGQSKFVSSRQVADIVNTAVDEGINFIDTARIYGCAEEGIGLALGCRRKEVFLATKVWADTITEAEERFGQSLKLLKTEQVDLLYFHSLGSRDVGRARRADGVFNWLLKQKQLGKTRFVGISGHNAGGRFPAFIESGDVDVVLMVLNFVDRHAYDFEEKVLPVACKHNLGVVAMKVLGGMRGGFDSYGGPKAPPQLDAQYLELAVRYALGLLGVATVNIGVHDAEQVRKNVRIVKNFRPLSGEEQALLEKVGGELARKWGPHFGPVEEKGDGA